MTKPREISNLAEGHITAVMTDAAAYAEGAAAISGAPQLLTTTIPAIPDVSARGGEASNPYPAAGEGASGAPVAYEDAQPQSIQFNERANFGGVTASLASLPSIPTLTPITTPPFTAVDIPAPTVVALAPAHAVVPKVSTSSVPPSPCC